MVELRMRADHVIKSPDSTIPKVRPDAGSSHIQRVVSSACIDQQRLAVWELEDAGIALSHVQEGDPQDLAIRQAAGRPAPPPEQQRGAERGSPPQRLGSPPAASQK